MTAGCSFECCRFLFFRCVCREERDIGDRGGIQRALVASQSALFLSGSFLFFGVLLKSLTGFPSFAQSFSIISCIFCVSSVTFCFAAAEVTTKASRLLSLPESRAAREALKIGVPYALVSGDRQAKTAASA